MPSDIPQDMLMDVRIVERNTRKGLVTRQDVEKHLAGLADLNEASVTVDTKLDRLHAEGEGSLFTAARTEEEEEID